MSVPRYFAFGSKAGFLPPSALLGEILQYSLMLSPYGSSEELGVVWRYRYTMMNFIEKKKDDKSGSRKLTFRSSPARSLF